MNLYESGEMYLETLLILLKSQAHVRSIDLAHHMNLSKPSVSRAVNLLKINGFINVGCNGHLTFTPKGKEIAEKIYERHSVLSNILASLGVDEKIATEDACRIEHVISEASFSAIKRHFEM